MAYVACHSPTGERWCVSHVGGAIIFANIPDMQAAKDLAAVMNLGREINEQGGERHSEKVPDHAG